MKSFIVFTIDKNHQLTREMYHLSSIMKAFKKVIKNIVLQDRANISFSFLIQLFSEINEDDNQLGWL